MDIDTYDIYIYINIYYIYIYIYLIVAEGSYYIKWVITSRTHSRYFVLSASLSSLVSSKDLSLLY